jgi:branched-chain amino acid transport system substrate-binding protein
MASHGSTIRRPARTGALLAALFMLAAGCGSQLTDQQILARSGTQSVRGVGGGPRATSPAGGVAPGSTATSLAGAKSLAGGTRSVVTGSGSSTVQAGGQVVGPTQATGSSGCSTSESGPIIIGNVGNYSGPAASSVGTWPVGVRVWAADINSRGGLCGRQVQVVVNDDGGDPARYASLVRSMVENQHVAAFVGNAAFLSAPGGFDYHNQSGVPVIGNDGTFDQEFVSPVMAPTWAKLDDTLTIAMKGSVQISGKTNFGYLFCNEANLCHHFDALYQGGAVTKAGARLVYRSNISITQIDFTAECQGARQAGVNLFTVDADEATLLRVARSCARQNFFPRWILGVVDSTVLSEPGLRDGIIPSSVFPYAGGSGPAIGQYQHAIDTFAPQQPSEGLAIGWASAKAFELVATRAAQTSHTITPASLLAALHTVTNETLGGLTGPLTFRADGAHNAGCSFFLEGDGKGGYSTPLGSEARCQ